MKERKREQLSWFQCRSNWWVVWPAQRCLSQDGTAQVWLPSPTSYSFSQLVITTKLWLFLPTVLCWLDSWLVVFETYTLAPYHLGFYKTLMSDLLLVPGQSIPHRQFAVSYGDLWSGWRFPRRKLCLLIICWSSLAHFVLCLRFITALQHVPCRPGEYSRDRGTNGEALFSPYSWP